MRAQDENSPIAVIGVLGVILAGVLGIWVIGQLMSGGFGTTISGTAYAVGDDGSAPRPVRELAGNPLVTPGRALPKVTCSLPELDTGAEGLRTYYTAGIACLDQVWKPALDAAGEPFSTPKLNVDEKPRSRCGLSPSKEAATAFYCDRDRTIYMPRDRLVRDAGDNPAYHLAILAHEYGHHVQNLSGILGATEDSGAPELESSRRTELQANCFAGMFVAAIAGSVDKDTVKDAVRSFEDTAGDETHGNPENQAKWATAGFEGADTAACNTWTAPDGEVS